MALPTAPQKERKAWSFVEWTGVVAAAIAVLGFIGYTTIWSLVPVGPLETGILGQWQATDRPWHLAFAPDKTVGMSTIGPLKRGNYRLDSNSILWIDMQDGHHYKATVTMPTRDRLNLVDADGSLTSFERVP